jgi:integrase
VRKPQLRVKEYPHSPTARWVIEGVRVEGKRKRLFFRTRAEADIELARIKIKRAREGEDALSISDSLRIMARDCAARLAHEGHTILEATDFYLAHLEAASRSISVEALISEYINSRARAGLSRVYLHDLHYRLGRFRHDFGLEPVRTLAPAQIEDWLHNLGLSPKSYNNFRDRLSTLFAYGVKRNYLSTNPAAVIAPIKYIDGPPEIFTVDELSAVLTSAGPDLLPVLVVGAFAGLRTAEALRLDWREVDLARGFIEIAAAKAKSARRRLIPVSDNLAVWLRPYAARTGKLWPKSQQLYHKMCGQLAASASLSRWPKNGLRHSYASYFLAQHQNAPELSLHMGHTSVRQVFDAYRELVRPDEAARYWAIRPLAIPGNIVQLEKAFALPR